MGIDLHRVSDGLELDCAFGWYQDPETLIGWAFSCGAFAPPAFTDDEYQQKAKLLEAEAFAELGIPQQKHKLRPMERDRLRDLYYKKLKTLFEVPGDPRPSVSAFSGSTGYEVSPHQVCEMLNRLPSRHGKYQYFIDFLVRCAHCGFTVD